MLDAKDIRTNGSVPGVIIISHFMEENHTRAIQKKMTIGWLPSLFAMSSRGSTVNLGLSVFLFRTYSSGHSDVWLCPGAF